MRLAIFCSSLEPGRDGVGDYSRRLAAECIRLGHACVLAALNDPYVSELRTETQETDGAGISALRVPAGMSWNRRVVEARHWLDDFNPDWVSFQFVPFGFHPKGLCFGLGKSLAAINPRAAWHIMFHELWLGLGENPPLKHRLWGVLQRSLVLDLVRRLRPKWITTQAEPYQFTLGREQISASLLPLFGNIPRAEGDGWVSILEPLVTAARGRPQPRESLYLAGILGGVHPEWDAEAAVNTLLPLTRRFQKQLVLVFHGKNNLPPDAFAQMKLKLQDRATVVVTGEKSTVEISQILQSLDLGLATSPRQNIQKSGSAAAMLEHGLTLLVTRDDWRVRGSNPRPDENFSRLLSPKQFAALENLPSRDLRPPVSGVTPVAEKMLATMNSFSRAEAKLAAATT